MRGWVAVASAGNELQTIKGIGPKTVDYLACLVGADRIAVDRHVISFTAQAGVDAGGYEDVQTIVSYAADLLGILRRDFDAWIWAHYARKQSDETQPDLLASLH
jgi:3-methyladenine DNA glycosylase/8-oxoguanine DNA glycosylase